MSIATDIREIAHDYSTHRDLLWQFVLRDVRIRYKQAAMGFLWALFLPLLLIGAGLVLRLALANRGGAVLAPGTLGPIALGSVLWAGFSAAVGFGTGSLTGNATLVGKIHFPREVLPVAAVCANGLDMLVGLGLLALLMPWLDAVASPALLWVPVLLLLLFGMTVALVLVLSAANLFFRDVKYLVQALLTVGVLVTPVFYAPSELGARASQWIALNPLTPIVEGMRLAVFRGHDLARTLVMDGMVVWSPLWLVRAAVSATLGLVIASLIFHRAEELFAERV